MSDEIKLTSQDPTIFVVCDKCNQMSPNGTYKTYYGTSFTKQQWRQEPKCENCNGELRIIRKIKVSR